MISCMLNIFKALVFTILGLCRRILCFWNKGKQSNRPNFDLLSTQPMDQYQLPGGPSHEQSTAELANWDTPTEVVIGGTEKPRDTVADHISAYRNSLQIARQQSLEPSSPEEPDLFLGLEPKVKRQKKVYVGPSTSKRSTGRLNMQQDQEMDPILNRGEELTDWGGGVGDSGWSVEDEDLSDVLRAQRKQNRQRVLSS